MSERGFVYSVYGEASYFDELHLSAESLRAAMPGAHVSAYVYASQRAQVREALFNAVVTLPEPDAEASGGVAKSFFAKIAAIRANPYAQFLYLDTDTFICADLSPLFELMGRFDVLAAHAPVRRRFRFENYVEPDYVSSTPEGFCEFNTGVLGFARTVEVEALLAAWEALYRAQPRSGDQYLFMDCVYASQTRPYVLPPEYNLRTLMPQYVYERARILHSRWQDLAAVAAAVNAATGQRLIRPAGRGVEVERFSAMV